MDKNSYSSNATLKMSKIPSEVKITQHNKLVHYPDLELRQRELRYRITKMTNRILEILVIYQ